MAILKVARLGHPVLRQSCRELTPAEIRSPEVASLVEDMRATMAEYGGVGLAAPQVHEPVRLALVEFAADTERYELERPYRVALYPWVPLAYMAGSLWIALYTSLERPIEAALSLATIASGLPLYWFWNRRS